MVVTFVSGRNIYIEQCDKCYVKLPHSLPVQVDECLLELWHYSDSKPFFEINLSQVVGIE